MKDELETTAARVLPLIDLTSLNDAGDDDVAALCEKAKTPAGNVAAVCVWPRFVAEARHHLAASGIGIGCVINFPDGGPDIAAAVAEARSALADGADELDLVMPFGAWIEGNRGLAKSLIATVKESARGRARLKVILETGALGARENIAAASRDAIEAGADFLKTSTGKRRSGATLEAAEAMLGAIREAGGRVGFKAAGGIRATAQAATYLSAADHILGDGWAEPTTFRIGASGLLDDVLAVLGHRRAMQQRSTY